MLGDLDLLEAEGAHHLDQDHDPGDDRRRPAGMQPGDLEPLLEGLRGEQRAHPLDRVEGEPVAVDALGVVGVELLVDRRQRGRRAGDGDPLLARGDRLAGQLGVDQRADVAGQRLELARRRAGRCAGSAPCGGRCPPEARCRSRPRPPSRPPARWSRRRCRPPACCRRRGRSAKAPRYTSRASSAPSRMRASSPKRSRSSAMNAPEFVGVPHRAGRDRFHRSAPSDS